MSFITKSEPVLEYKDLEENSTLIIEKDKLSIKSNERFWLFPGRTRIIDTKLCLYIPYNSVGLITKNNHLNSNIQLDSQVIYSNNNFNCVYISITNRGILPVKINYETKLADLIILSKTECHIVNSKG